MIVLDLGLRINRIKHQMIKINWKKYDRNLWKIVVVVDVRIITN
jgi:hypothetical protein